MYIGALEAGGTKMVCAVGTDKGKIISKTSIKTTEPQETIPKIIKYFKEFENDKKDKIQMLGIGAFGPVDLDKKSVMYGHILNTPKKAWRGYDILGTLEKGLKIKAYIDTDVNAACLGEVMYGCAKGLENVIYITIGTGIGVGIWCNNKLVHGMLHPEAGHILVKRHKNDTYEGKCPSHKSCFEGMAAGPAIEERWGVCAVDLHSNEEVWKLEAYYIAQALVNYICILSPQKIILGGGVMHQEKLFPLIRKEVKRIINGYLITKELEDIDNYIVPCSLDDEQGVLGAIQLGMNIFE